MPRSREILLPWDSQPQEATGPDSSWTQQGLVAAFVRQGGRIIDAAGDVFPSTNSATDTVNQAGLVSDYSGTAVTEWTDRAKYQVTGAFTLLIGVDIDAFSSYTGLAFKQGTTTRNAPFEIRHGYNGISGTSTTGQYLDVVRANASSYSEFASTNATASSTLGRQVIAVRFADGDLATVPSLFRNGSELNVITRSIGSGVVTNGGNVRLGRRYDGGIQLDGRIEWCYLFNTSLTNNSVQSLSDNPWQLFAPQTIWVPVSAGGGGTTISATPGNAVADGTTASVNRTIPATPGNASASGTTASVIRVIGAAPGNAVADGTTAAVTRSIAATPGNAVADGVTATVTNSGTTTISCTPGNAAADGALAAITRTIAAAPGNAVANGAIAALLRVIATTPGNAVADGVTAAVQASVTISCTPGNAVADGVAATVTAAVSQLDLILKILVNRQELNPATGTFTLYDDDATTVLYTTNAWADAAGTVPYSGGALRRIDALI